MFKRFFLILIGLFFSITSFAQPQLKPNAPAKYVVQPGDTIWSIACHYLDEPWQWPDLYQVNTDLSNNPDKIYPGDILILKFPNGHARVIREGRNTLKLTPTMREEPLETPIPTIPYAEIKPFLRGMRVVDLKTLQTAPYVLAIHGEEKMGAVDTQVYIKNLDYPYYQDYYVYRQERELVDPVSKQVFGYEAKHIGNARILRYRPGSPAVAKLTGNKEEVMPGDKLSPIPPLTNHDDIMLRQPKVSVEGQVIAILTEDSQVGQHQIVIINRGKFEGLRIGDVLAIYRNGQMVPDPELPQYKRYYKKHMVKLPNDRLGELVIFKLFNRVALGLIMNSTQEIVKLDHVTNP